MKKRKYIMYCFYLPAIFMLAFFIIRPFVSTLYTSLCRWNGYSGQKKFIGFENYLTMVGDKNFRRAFINTLLYGFVSSGLLQNVFGLAGALFVNSRFKGNNVVRVVIYLPIMISSLIMGYIMFFFFAYDQGVINEMLGWFGIEARYWLADGKKSVLIIIIINAWQSAGSSMLIYLAGLQNIPRMYQEAAVIDGAGKSQIFRYVTLPLLVPAMMTSVITSLIGGLKMFEMISAFTNGGPNYQTHSLMTYLSQQYFDKERAGYAAAIGLVTFGFIMLVSLVANRFFEARMVEE